MDGQWESNDLEAFVAEMLKLEVVKKDWMGSKRRVSLTVFALCWEKHVEMLGSFPVSSLCLGILSQCFNRFEALQGFGKPVLVAVCVTRIWDCWVYRC